MKERPARALRSFEVLILRPLSIAIPVAAVVCLVKAAWVLAVAMLMCGFLLGVIGQALPHRKQQTIPELTGGGKLPTHDEKLSYDDAFALAKAIQRTALLAGFTALFIGWQIGLRWYWLFLLTLGTYSAVGLPAALLGVRKPTIRPPDEIPVGLPDWREEEKKILFGDYKRKH